MNTTREVVAPAMKAAADDMAGEDLADRIFTPDTRDLMGFFVIMRRLLMEVNKSNQPSKFVQSSNSHLVRHS